MILQVGRYRIERNADPVLAMRKWLKKAIARIVRLGYSFLSTFLCETFGTFLYTLNMLVL